MNRIELSDGNATWTQPDHVKITAGSYTGLCRAYREGQAFAKEEHA
jgi:hypothetical protein